jgi:hypothetical protein
MEHPICRVVSFEMVAPYTLRIAFDDGVEREIDFRPILAGELYGPLRSEAVFARVEIDPEAHTLIWPNGADFDPYVLHEWPAHVESMKKMARRWRKAESPRHPGGREPEDSLALLE